MFQGIADALLSGILVALTSWLPPLSPEGSFGHLIDGMISYTAFLVPAYAGIMFSVLYRYKERLSKEPLMVLRGVETSELQYFVVGVLLTLMLGLPPLAKLLEAHNTVLDVFNLILAVLITFFGLTWPRLTILKGAESKIPSKPSFLDAVLAGVFQSFSSTGGVSRAGLAILALILPGHEAENVLEWGGF
ncbi:undecaprenyl-diphosphate phosphatase [Thermococcus peptonophilus]|uniref:undecaprenyl-diphosphate phosphatase n=1 Tax=Thermococcus peptonophilus TaxID=53952 RepID=UPI0006D00F0A